MGTAASVLARKFIYKLKRRHCEEPIRRRSNPEGYRHFLREIASLRSQ